MSENKRNDPDINTPRCNHKWSFRRMQDKLSVKIVFFFRVNILRACLNLSIASFLFSAAQLECVNTFLMDLCVPQQLVVYFEKCVHACKGIRNQAISLLITIFTFSISDMIQCFIFYAHLPFTAILYKMRKQGKN